MILARGVIVKRLLAAGRMRWAEWIGHLLCAENEGEKDTFTEKAG